MTTHSADNNTKFKWASAVRSLVHSRLAPSKSSKHREATEAMFSSLQTLFEKLAVDFNSSIAHEPLMVAVRKPVIADEDRDHCSRLIVATSFWAVSIRGINGTVEFFTLPATELPRLSSAELPSRAKLRFTFNNSSHGPDWLMDGLSVTSDEMNTLMRTLFKDVAFRSKADYERMPESQQLVAGAQSLTRSVRSLLGEKHALVQKIVNQQEAIQNQIARDLHDAVLGNVMLLKRSLSSGTKRMPDGDMTAVLDEIATRLREICQDLSPRDLKDVGLRPMLEELCNNLYTRANLNCNFDCPETLPDFPDEVALHIYRIAQECFNNIVKHASAANVDMNIRLHKGLFTMVIKDDGKGFEAELAPGRTRDGGSGTSIIRERAALIECIYPTRVWIDSQPGSGTRMTLEIMFASEPDIV